MEVVMEHCNPRNKDDDKGIKVPEPKKERPGSDRNDEGFLMLNEEIRQNAEVPIKREHGHNEQADFEPESRSEDDTVNREV
jgi:hypothetical protein